jgi:hypothetical protein
MNAEAQAFIQVIQLALSVLIIPLLVVLFKLYEKLRDLEISIEKRFVTKEDFDKVEERVGNVERFKTTSNRLGAVQRAKGHAQT